MTDYRYVLLVLFEPELIGLNRVPVSSTKYTAYGQTTFGDVVAVSVVDGLLVFVACDAATSDTVPTQPWFVTVTVPDEALTSTVGTPVAVCPELAATYATKLLDVMSAGATLAVTTV